MASDYSIDTGLIKTFGTVDYVLFSVFLCALAAIGFYHAYRDRKKTSVEDFHFAGRNMHPIPVALSLTATFLSSLTIIGVPAEIYTNGTMYYYSMISQIIGSAAAAHVFVPVFYKLKTTSCFQYINMRFGFATKVVTSIFYMIQGFIYMGFVLYAPSLAFQAVTGLSFWGCMVGVSAVCILYTALGGMKSVLWTDSLQVGIILFGMLAAVIEGSAVMGGFGKAWEIARENGRIEFDNVSFDPRIRHSIWNVIIGFSLFWTYLYGVNQAQVQRACSLSSLRRAQIAIWLNVPGFLIIMTLACLLGIVMFAFYSGCDPVKSGLVHRNDQMVPLFVMDVLSSPTTFGRLPGFPGVFLASVFSSCLSTISSGLNAMSAVILEDYIKPISRTVCQTTIIDRHEIVASKILVIISGLIQFGFAGLLTVMPGLIVSISLSIYSLIAGPILGVFVVGMLFRWTNKFGAMLGFLIGLSFVSWVGIGTLIEKPAGLSNRLPISIDNCFQINETSTNSVTSFTTTTVTNTSLTDPSTTITASTTASTLQDLYRLSYTWYTGLGMIVCIFVALIVSLITNCFIEKSKVNTNLLVPLFDILLPCLPERFRKPLRCGFEYDIDDDGGDKKDDGENKDLDHPSKAPVNDDLMSNETIFTRL